MNEINENDLENKLAGQIPEAPMDEQQPIVAQPQQPQEEVRTPKVGEKLNIDFEHRYNHEMSEETANEIKRAGLSRIGENVFENAEIRDGWLDYDRALLGERDLYYPANWEFRVRPATVEAIRNWSTIDDENFNVIDDVFNEMIKSCLKIINRANGQPIPNTKLNSWDRFNFILTIREYSMESGEKVIRLTEDCPSCDNPVEFELKSSTLMYDMPDPELLRYYDQETQTWTIDPNEYDVEWPQAIKLYLPTLQKEMAIKQWMINKIQNKKKVDQVFLKFLPWMAPSISADQTVAENQIKQYKMQFDSWNVDMFSLMDDIIKNITVTPNQKLITKCPTCGEEVTTDIRFQDGVSGLFNRSSRRKKFGKK